jgi:hypothetical protein
MDMVNGGLMDAPPRPKTVIKVCLVACGHSMMPMARLLLVSMIVFITVSRDV